MDTVREDGEAAMSRWFQTVNQGEDWGKEASLSWGKFKVLGTPGHWGGWGRLRMVAKGKKKIGKKASKKQNK